MNLKNISIWIVITFVLWPIVDTLLGFFSINLPIVRYLIYGFGTYQIIRLYNISYKNTKKNKGLISLLITILIFWLSIRYLWSIPDLLAPESNYLNLKQTLSGEFILFFSIFLFNITFSFQTFKMLLKVSYWLAILFLIIALPLFTYFTSDIHNNAEWFVKYFQLGSVFLLLLFPYQKAKVNILLSLSVILSVLIMMLVARRNVILYLVSSLFFLSLVVIFSKSKLIKRNKPLLILGSIVGIIALVSIFLVGFNFDLLIERTETGLGSRVDVFEEFEKDFDKHPLDWFFGRGPFGTFESVIGDRGNYRTLIENGYYQYILQKGLLFLIPFVLISFIAAYKGFFQSKNHLSKAAAILILVNLMDMVGYGLPFLGLKYLNLLIAFGFCFSASIRNIDDLKIRDMIRI